MGYRPLWTSWEIWPAHRLSKRTAVDAASSVRSVGSSALATTVLAASPLVAAEIK
jgi:hypothetical protein